MAKKQPGHRALAQVVWMLTRIPSTGVIAADAVLGHFTSEARAIAQVARVIAKEAGLTQVRLPAWSPTADGKELIFGRADRTWHFALAVCPLDVELV